MTQFTATERKTVQSVTVKDDGTSDIISLVEVLDGERVVCRNTIRETVDTSDAVDEIERLRNAWTPSQLPSTSPETEAATLQWQKTLHDQIVEGDSSWGAFAWWVVLPGVQEDSARQGRTNRPHHFKARWWWWYAKQSSSVVFLMSCQEILAWTQRKKIIFKQIGWRLMGK
jgi:hypothetical protein